MQNFTWKDSTMKKKFVLFLFIALILSACAGQKQQLKSPQPKAAVPEKPVKAAAVPAPAHMKSGGENLLIIGEAEYVTIKPANIRYRARIDTGATTSSIHAVEIKKFERDGKKWVRFKLVASSGEKVAMQRPVIRTIEVKRHGTDQQSRPVVSLKIVMGPIKKTTQFSLTDRSQFKYPVLIGRSFLKGTALVDVNRSYILAPLSGEDHEK
jgi:hypothetical protein